MKAVRLIDTPGKELTDRQAASCSPSRSPEGKKQDGRQCTIRNTTARFSCGMQQRISSGDATHLKWRRTSACLIYMCTRKPKNCKNCSTRILFAIEGMDVGTPKILAGLVVRRLSLHNRLPLATQQHCVPDLKICMAQKFARTARRTEENSSLHSYQTQV